MKRIVFWRLLLSLGVFLNGTLPLRAESMLQKSDTTQVSTVITHIRDLGNLVYDSPKAFLKARDSLLQVTFHLQPKTDKEYTAYQLLLLNMGYALAQDAQVLKSIEVYEKALALYYEHPDTLINFLEYYVKPLGSLYTMSGNIQHAALLQRRALKYAKASNEEKASVYANLAITIKELKQYDSVIAVCHRGLRYTSPQSLTAARHYNELADSFLQLHRGDSAQFYNQKALHILTRPRSQNQQAIVWEANAWGIKAQIGLFNKDYEATAVGLKKALHLLKSNFSHSHFRERSKLYELQGDLFVAYQQYERAIEAFHNAIDLLKPNEVALYPDYTVTYSFTGLGEAYLQLHQPDSAIAYYLKAVQNDYLVQQFITTKKSSYYNSARNRETLQKLSDVLYRQLLSTADKKQKETYIYQLLWATELSKGRQLVNALSRSSQWSADTAKAVHVLQVQEQLRYLYRQQTIAESTEKRKKIKREIEKIIYQYALSENIFNRQYQQPDFFDFIKKIKKISRDHLVLSWQINSDSISYVVQVNDGQPKVFALEHSARLKYEIQHFKEAYFYSGPLAYINNPQQYFEESNSLVKQLIPNISTVSQKKWLISPDGFIYGLPLNAMTLDGKFLIEDHRLQSIYTFLHYEPGIKNIDSTLEVDIFAKQHHQPPFVDLPNIAAEIKAISSAVNTRVFKGNKATFKNLQSALNQEVILHISTHAVADQSGTPYLVLDKKIDLNRLQFVLTRTPLVILSACETGKGEAVTGEGMESLNKAFISKGVDGVIAARWNVSDAFIPQFMQQFYKVLSQVKNPAEALRQTQLYFIHNSNNKRFQNPWLWASLNYTGKTMHLQIMPAQNNTNREWWIWGGLAMLILGGVWFGIERTKKQ